MLEIKKGTNGFYIGDSEENALARISYVPKGPKLIVLDSTFVADEIGGQGIGKQLLKELVGWARKENKKIVPICPYAKAQMEKNKEYHDMIYKR